MLKDRLIAKNLQIFEKTVFAKEKMDSLDIQFHTKQLHPLYATPYAENFDYPRKVHGIAHVARVAFYVPIIAHLYQRYDETLQLLPNDIAYIQLAALFHDLGREGEEEDQFDWELDSALFLYYYLVNKSLANPQEASELAEIIANKDYIPRTDYYVLALSNDGLNTPIWVVEENSTRERTLFQKILHDADCLDVIRARDKYDATYLDIFQQFIKQEDIIRFTNPLLEIGELICEVRSLIEYCGDTRHAWVSDRQLQFDCEECYEEILRCIEDNIDDFPMMSRLYNANCPVLDFPQLYGLSPQSNNLLHHVTTKGTILVHRGVMTPSAHHDLWSLLDDYNHPSIQEYLYQLNKATQAASIELAFDYMRRSFGDSFIDGNENRSVAILGMGARVYANAGFGILTTPEHMCKIFEQGDADTGRGIIKRFFDPISRESDQRKEELRQLGINLLLGGVEAHKGLSLHTEAIMDISMLHCIIFSDDPTVGMANVIHQRTNRPYPGVPLLEAIFLHAQHCIFVAKLPRYQDFDSITDQINLPLYQYSGLHNRLKEVPFPSSTQILDIWIQLIDSLFTLQEFPREQLYSDEQSYFDAFKVLACYGVTCYKIGRKTINITPLDKFYPSELKQQIEAHLRKKLISEILYDITLPDLSRALIDYLLNPEGRGGSPGRELPMIIKKEALRHIENVASSPHKACYYAQKVLVALDLFQIENTPATYQDQSVYPLLPPFRSAWISSNSVFYWDEENSNLADLSSLSPDIWDNSVFEIVNEIGHVSGPNIDYFELWKKYYDHHIVSRLKSGLPLVSEYVIHCCYALSMGIHNNIISQEWLIKGRFLYEHIVESLDNRPTSSLSQELEVIASSIILWLFDYQKRHPNYSFLGDIQLQVLISIILRPNNIYPPAIHLLKTLSDSTWSMIFSEEHFESGKLLLCVCKCIDLDITRRCYNLHQLLLEKSPDSTWSDRMSDELWSNEHTVLNYLLCSLMNAPEDSKLLGYIQLAVKRSSADKWFMPFHNDHSLTGATPLIIILLLVIEYKNSFGFKQLACISAKEAPLDAWSITITNNPSLNGETAFRLLFQLLKYFIDNQELLCRAHIVANQVPRASWSITLDDSALYAGNTALRELFEILDENPLSVELQILARIAAQRALPEAWSIPLTNHNCLEGDTAFRRLMCVIRANPTDMELIRIANSIAPCVSELAWSTPLTNHHNYSGSTALTELQYTLEENPEIAQHLDASILERLQPNEDEHETYKLGSTM